MTEKRRKVSHVGVPAIFELHLACKPIVEAFGGFGCYLVGSALERPDWRDIDVVFILSDDEFRREFPNAEIAQGAFELDAKWMLNSIGISMLLAKQTGLPVDFKMQPQTWANKRHSGPRHPLGITVSVENEAA